MNLDKKMNSLIKRIVVTWLILSLLFGKHSQFHSTVRQILVFILALTSVFLAKSVLRYWKIMTLWNITELNGDCAGWPYHVLKSIWWWNKFPQPIKHLLSYFPYKNCKHSLISIDFIAPVYKLFDSLSCSELITFFQQKY